MLTIHKTINDGSVVIVDIGIALRRVQPHQLAQSQKLANESSYCCWPQVLPIALPGSGKSIMAHMLITTLLKKFILPNYFISQSGFKLTPRNRVFCFRYWYIMGYLRIEGGVGWIKYVLITACCHYSLYPTVKHLESERARSNISWAH